MLKIDDIAVGLTAPMPAVVDSKKSASAVEPMHPKQAVVQKNEIRHMYDYLGKLIYDAGFKSVPGLMRVMDDDRSGFLSRLEFRGFLKDQFNVPHEKSDRFFNILDLDGDGKVNCAEFGYGIAPFLDPDGDGFVGDEDGEGYVSNPRGHDSVRSKRRENEIPAGTTTSSRWEQQRQALDYVPPVTLPQPPCKPMKDIDLSRIILDQVRAIISKRGGSNAFHTLYRTFRAICFEKQDDVLATQDIREAFEYLGVILKEKDIHLLVSALASSDNGTIDFQGLVTKLRGDRSKMPHREQAIEKAWLSLNRKSDATYGDVSMEFQALLKQFNPSYHPEVLAGRMKTSDALEDMQNQLEDFTTANGRLKRTMFTEYHRNLSVCIESDQLFEKVLRGAWDEVKSPAKGWAGAAVATDKKVPHRRS
jgi:Ca2+-binding EF-hand superfamily protein